MITASIKKLHSLSSALTAAEQAELRTTIVDERSDFGDEVTTWSTKVATMTDAIFSMPAVAETATTPAVPATGMHQLMEGIMEEFKEDVLESTDPLSTIKWLEKLAADDDAEMKDKGQTELALGHAMGEEVKDWLEKHIADLQAALAEICEREHAYHYSPPGYHVDEDAIDLQAFERLSERFTLMVVQMTGTFDGFTTEINKRIGDLK